MQLLHDNPNITGDYNAYSICAASCRGQYPFACNQRNSMGLNDHHYSSFHFLGRGQRVPWLRSSPVHAQRPMANRRVLAFPTHTTKRRMVMGELLTTRTNAFLKTEESDVTDERIRNVINKLDDAYIALGYSERPAERYDRARMLLPSNNPTSDCPDDRIKLNVEIFRMVRKACDLDYIQSMVSSRYDEWSDLIEDMLSICILHDLRPSTVDPMQLSYIPDVMAEGRDRRVRGKPAKIIRKLFPLRDEQVEDFFRMYNTAYNPMAFTLVHGCTSEHFFKAYATDNNFTPETDISHMKLPSRNQSKALSNSCMRWWDQEVGFRWQREGMHPAEIFATKCEYMHIAYTLDDKKRVASRACYSPTDNVCSSIYGTSMKSVFIIDEFFKEQGYLPSLDRSYWPNFTVRRVEHSNDSNMLFMPYLDMNIRRFKDAEVLCTKGGEICLVQGQDYEGGSSTSGFMDIEHSNYCESCEENLRGDDYRTDYDGYIYCEHCYDDRYVCCAASGYEVLREDAIELDYIRLPLSRRGHDHHSPFDYQVMSSYYHEDNVSDDAYCVDGEWYSLEHPIISIRENRMNAQIYTGPMDIRTARNRSSVNHTMQIRSLTEDEKARMMDVLYQDPHSGVPTIDFEGDHEDSAIILPTLNFSRSNVLIMIDVTADFDALLKSLSEQIKNELEG